jgi:hypothetical protein
MRICLILLSLLATFGVHGESNRPFVRLEQSVQPKDSYKLPSACSFRKFYPQHMAHLVKVVLPRAENEINELIVPHTLNGEPFAVADTVSYADLFHFHWRFSSEPTSFTEAELTDPKNYHLLYHSFEHLDYLLVAWLRSIDSMITPGTAAKDSNLSLWLAERMAQNSASSTSSVTGDHAIVTNSPINLSDENIQTLAARWDSFLGQNSPGKYRLVLRLKVLNDKFHELSAITELLANRNLASFPDHYEILRFSSLPDSWQPVTVYFDKIENNPKIAAELRAFLKNTGEKWLSNPEGPTAAYFPLDKELKAQSIEAMHNIKNLAKKNLDPLNVFKKTTLGVSSTITAFAITNEYIFAVSHSISDTECL